MRFSWFAAGLLLLASCSRTGAPSLRRLAILPVEDLTGSVDSPAAEALQFGIWDSLQGQPRLYAMLAPHRRELPALQPTDILDGYLAPNRAQFYLNGESIPCAGTPADCLPVIAREAANRLNAGTRPHAKIEALLLLAEAHQKPSQAAALLEKATAADPTFAAAWINRSVIVAKEQGTDAAAALLASAIPRVAAGYDAARLRLQLADWKRDAAAGAQAIVELAKAAPADIAFQRQAAGRLMASRRFVEALAILDHIAAFAPDAAAYNEAAYAAAFHGDRAAAERNIRSARSLQPNVAQWADTEGDIAYYFGDFAAAARVYEESVRLDTTFMGGLDHWKAADAWRLAGDAAKAEAALQRYLELRAKSGQRNTLLIQASWNWRSLRPEAALSQLDQAEATTEKSKAIFFTALAELSQRRFGAAEQLRMQLPDNTPESVLLRAILHGTPPPQGLQVSPALLGSLHAYFRGDTARAKTLLAQARQEIHPFTEGAVVKLDALLHQRKVERILPTSADDWLAFLLATAQ